MPTGRWAGRTQRRAPCRSRRRRRRAARPTPARRSAGRSRAAAPRGRTRPARRPARRASPCCAGSRPPRPASSRSSSPRCAAPARGTRPPRGSPRASERRSSCRYSGSLQPCRARRNGVTMSDFTGPGRNSEMSMMRSPKVSGANLPISSRWPGDSIWKQPRVCADCTSAKVAGSSRSRSSSSMRSPVVRSISSTAWAIEDCMRMPSTSSFSRPISSTSSLSKWLIGKPAALRSTGVRSSRVVSDSSTPQGWRATCRGRPSSFSTRSRKVSSRPDAASRPNPEVRSSGRSARALRASRARMCGKDLAKASTSPAGMPRAAPTSRTACRTR